MKSKTVEAAVQLLPPTPTKAARLVITDKMSGLEFASLELPPGSLEALLLGRQASVSLIASAIGKYLGKKRVRESRTVVYPGSFADDTQVIYRWLEPRIEPGWYLEPIRAIDLHQLGGQLYVTYNLFKFEKP